MDTTTKRNHPFKVVCAWCGLVLQDGIMPISHGQCPSCLAVTLAEAEEFHRQLKK